MMRVASMLMPSGARIVIWNCDSSSSGRKLMFAILSSGTVLTSVSTLATTITQRCRSDQPRMRMYVRSMNP